MLVLIRWKKKSVYFIASCCPHLRTTLVLFSSSNPSSSVLCRCV